MAVLRPFSMDTHMPYAFIEYDRHGEINIISIALHLSPSIKGSLHDPINDDSHRTSSIAEVINSS